MLCCHAVSVTFVYCVKTATDMAVVATQCEQETIPKLPNITISMTLSDPEPRINGHAMILNISETVRDRY